jgi:metal transporter CNNM
LVAQVNDEKPIETNPEVPYQLRSAKKQKVLLANKMRFFGSYYWSLSIIILAGASKKNAPHAASASGDEQQHIIVTNHRLLLKYHDTTGGQPAADDDDDDDVHRRREEQPRPEQEEWLDDDNEDDHRRHRARFGGEQAHELDHYREMKQLLDALGLQNACHPTRSDLLDYFPRCSSVDVVPVVAASTAIVPSSSSHPDDSKSSRQLKGEDEESNSEGEQQEETEATTRWDQDDENEETQQEESEWIFHLADVILAILCVITSSVAAGLTVSLLSLDPLALMIKARAGDAVEARQAQELLPIIRQRHLLLVTLMLVNTASYEALPVVLHDLMPKLFVIIISVTLILVFGEILPIAIFTGHNQLAIASSLASLVHVFMWLLYPIAYPIAKLLDFFVPHDDRCAKTNYTRNELAALIRLQYEARCTAEQQRKAQEGEQQSPTTTSTKQQQGDKQLLSSPRGATGATTGSAERNNNNNTPSSLLQQQKIHRTFSLDLVEVMMAEGALALRSRQAADLVIPHRKVFSISYDAALTEKMIVHIFASGYSRIPVYRGGRGHGDDNDPNRKQQICGILMTRQLILVKATDNKKVCDLPLHAPRCIAPSMDLVALVNLFQTGGGVIGPTRRSVGHMAIVCARPDMANEALQADGDQAIPLEAGVMGIITMEDVLEALLQEQIYDEMDAAGRVTSIHSDSISVSTAGTARNNKSGSPRFQHTFAAPKQPLTSADNTNYYKAMP